MNFISSLKQCVRYTGRLLFYIFLISLPVAGPPIVWGIATGIKFHFWQADQILKNTNALTFEIDQHSRMSYWNVPGAQTIHQFQDNQAPSTLDEYASIDRMGSLDDLVRSGPDNLPTEYWIYVTFMPEYGGSEWDKAFSEILQQSYARPAHPKTAFFYVSCLKTQFLCGVWGVKAPSLVHLTVENYTVADSMEMEPVDHSQHLSYDYGCPPDKVRPVTARVIELPLEDDHAIHFLPRNVLPTPFLQLRTLIFDAPRSAIVDQFDPWNPLMQDLARFHDRLLDLCDIRGSGWYYFDKADQWYEKYVLKPVLGGEINDVVVGVVQPLTFSISLAIASIVRMPFNWGWSLYSLYFGLGWDGEPLGTHTWPGEEDLNEDGYAGMWGDMISGFWDFAAEKMAAQEVEAAASAAVTSRVP
ncbi:uncharacterized protein AB675_4762 [Cyphellophora attinorum]|uniref:Uncharacterized protein n=1 Tax=Cyphellophora attinorum TaxID=1664694 RepID=A0A0N1HI31_9EURO|nr:uncharacterized protein AB675_4762 [Phialophora attinorum]KPI35627.1 hypothetical protein AB675_4762 [Phialophora attinorum]